MPEKKPQQPEPAAEPPAEGDLKQYGKRPAGSGRKPAFQEEKLTKVNLFLPKKYVVSLKVLASKAEKTPSKLIADWIEEHL